MIFGCANQAGEDNRNVARMSLLLAGVHQSVPGITVNRLCASGMSAAVGAHRAILADEGDVFIAGGVEQMTRAPYVLSKTTQAFGRDAQLFDTTMGWRFINSQMKDLYGVDSMGETAENVAAKFSISRDSQDAFAAQSQTKATAARAGGRFREEIVSVQVPVGKGEIKSFSDDEFIREGTTAATLAKLKPAFKKDGSVTAGNSSGINDGACALLITSDVVVKDKKLTPLARIVGSIAVGVEPKYMGLGPVPAVTELLKKHQLTLETIDIIELNEAFAAQSLGCLLELGIDPNDARLNPNGGAIALGHPLGMSGARLLLTAARELQNAKKRYALCTMCVGVGQGVAVLLERA